MRYKAFSFDVLLSLMITVIVSLLMHFNIVTKTAPINIFLVALAINVIARVYED